MMSVVLSADNDATCCLIIRTGDDDDDVHVLYVLDRHVRLELHRLAHHQQQRLHHGETAEHRTAHEVWREDRSMPTWYNRSSKVHTYNGVNRKYKWCC